MSYIPHSDTEIREMFERVRVDTLDAELIVQRLLPEGIFAGIPLGRFYKEREKEIPIAVTERRTD